ncbi:ribokinase [Sinorhizobium alkalisoli]|uniref:Ribokinase n=1 Tax=Sinorhizobium alkalisoli TaxID=1752398 RepID=A0A1E3V8U7_9HYPH|nr:ribokinase [Sinorhizobium alkalisoli]MCA1491058.1 ribokinase [Ensifer sp. NBAIM29]MCG5482468.1 ribokinase [Sinorhizobium meliloti]ODR89949.1 ribokinase [Sinorhizobium alkalisoli]QFI64927.1 Ribokinase [Sinorhizobium alkalisoli]
MITVLGSINMDLIATTTRLPKPGETVAGTGFATAAGGKGANQALAARRAGASVRIAGAVGSDGFAEGALALLREAGADLSLVKTAVEPTGTAHIMVDGEGENVIVVVAGANATVSASNAVAAVESMSVGDTLMLQLEIPAASVEKALTEARRRRIRSVINIAPLTPDAARLGRMADIVIANETEFELLAGRVGIAGPEREAAMMALHAETGQTLIVTLGADGAVAIHDGEVHRAKGLAIEPVDTVGAGDTFCGYLAASLDSGLFFPEALRRAAVAGSLACLKPGAQPAIPFASEVAVRL